MSISTVTVSCTLGDSDSLTSRPEGRSRLIGSCGSQFIYAFLLHQGVLPGKV